MSRPTLISKTTIHPTQKSTLPDLKLSVSDLPMLSCNYIQKGLLFTRPPQPTLDTNTLISILLSGLAQTLSRFPPLAGRLSTDPQGRIYVACNDAGAEFTHANAAAYLTLSDILSPLHVPDTVNGLFQFASDGAVSYDGHSRPLLAVQVTELADGIFVGMSVNHAVMDGTSFWNFFNVFAEVCRGSSRISNLPDFRRNYFGESTAVLRFPGGAPAANFAGGGPLRERIFHFSREEILELKERANGRKFTSAKERETSEVERERESERDDGRERHVDGMLSRTH